MSDYEWNDKAVAAIAALGRSAYQWNRNRMEEKRNQRALREIQLLQQGDKAAPFRQAQDPARYVRDLIAEVNAHRASDSPRLEAAFSSGYHPKTQERFQSDQQRSKFLRGMLSGFGYPSAKESPKRWEEIDRLYGPESAAKIKDAMMRYATNDDGYRTDNDSQSEYHGFLGPGSPLHTAMTWGQGVPGMILALGEMGGRAADPVSAPEKDPKGRLIHALNTFTAPGQFLAGAIGYAPEVPPDHSAWSAQRAVQRAQDAQIPWSELQPEFAREVRDELINKADRQMLGREYLTNRGASPAVAAIGGGMIDDLLNPFLDIPGIRAAAVAKHGRLGKTAVQLGQEFLPGLTINAYLADQSLPSAGAKRKQSAPWWTVDPRAWGGQ